MSAISTYLEHIRSKIYAKDVRTAIVNAISQCYDDVNKPALQTEAMQAAVQAAVQAKIDAGEMAAYTVADGSFSGAKLEDGTVTADKLASDVIPDIDFDDLNNKVENTTEPGKNLYNPLATYAQVDASGNHKTGYTINPDGSVSCTRTYGAYGSLFLARNDFILQPGTYTISAYVEFGEQTANNLQVSMAVGKAAYKNSYIYAERGEYERAEASALTGWVFATFTLVEEQAFKFSLLAKSSNTASATLPTTFSSIQIEKGQDVTDYTARFYMAVDQTARYGIETINKNYGFETLGLSPDIQNTSINANTGAITLGGADRASVVYPCLPNTKYKISKVAGTRFAVGCSNAYPAGGTTCTKVVGNNAASVIEFVTNDTAKYLIAFVYYKEDPIGRDEMLNSVQLDIYTTIDAIARTDIINLQNNPYTKTFDSTIRIHKQEYIVKQAGFKIPLSGVVGSPVSNQGTQIYNNILFQLYADDVLVIIDISDGSILAQLSIDCGHGNSIDFTDVYYDDNDEFPLAIVVGSGNPERTITLVRITRESCTTIATITTDVEKYGYYPIGAYDVLNHIYYTLGYKINSATVGTDNEMILSAFKATVTNNGFAFAYIDSKTFPFYPTHQGMVFYNGMLVFISSPPSNPQTKIVFVTVFDGRVCGVINDYDFASIKTIECEGVAFDSNGKLLLTTINQNVFWIDFKY